MALAMVRFAHGAAANRAAVLGMGLRMRMRATGSIGFAASRLFAIQTPRWRRQGGGHRAGDAAWRRFCVRAADVSGPGSVDSLIAGMQSKIQEQLKAQEVIVKDAYGDGRHVSIEVVAEVFEGQTQVNRQRMVYKAIWEELQNAVHAVDQLKTRTPSEAKS